MASSRFLSAGTRVKSTGVFTGARDRAAKKPSKPAQEPDLELSIPPPLEPEVDPAPAPLAPRPPTVVWGAAVLPTWDEEGCRNCCSRNEALMLLEAAQGVSVHFRGFATGELAGLVGITSFVRLDADDALCARGERATFVAIVLRGSAKTRGGTGDADDSKAVIGRGSTIGELAFFTGGRRTASCFAQPGTIVGVIEFARISALHESDPQLSARA